MAHASEHFLISSEQGPQQKYSQHSYLWRVYSVPGTHLALRDPTGMKGLASGEPAYQVPRPVPLVPASGARRSSKGAGFRGFGGRIGSMEGGAGRF